MGSLNVSRRLGRTCIISTSKPVFSCRRCRANASRQQFSPSTTLIFNHHRNASTSDNKAPYIEKLRRKLWVDEPPGAKDPYRESQLLQSTQKESEVEPEPATQLDAIAETEAEAMEEPAANEGFITQATGIDESYVPADTWDGLDRIGGATGWWEEAWDEEHVFQSFSSSSSLHPTTAFDAVRRAVVEVYALKQARLPLTRLSKATTAPFTDFAKVDIIAAREQFVTLKYKNSSVQKAVLGALADGISSDIAALTDASGPISTANAELSKGENMQIEPTPRNHPWLRIKIVDLEVKFAITKRILQLTGIRIPDPVIGKAKHIEDIVGYVLEKPKAKKLAESLLAKPELADLPNVQIFERRHTPIDKQKEVGRWKIIERELQKRGLPVTGSLST